MPKKGTAIPKPIQREEAEKAFDAMLLRNKAMLWHICSGFNLGKAWSAEDCMQEVIYVLWRDFGQFEGRSSERTWVYRVATNAMLMLKRKQLRSLTSEPIEDIEKDLSTDNDIEDENLQQLNQLIEDLPHKECMMIRAHLDGFSYKEIADMTESTVGAVAMRIARTKRRLKKMYEEENNKTSKSK
ncbi:MAG: RNA polymerase sigma factor [Bacteroidales bacterium]|nr:RNA polymerase sigma factor [Bacteroidales bacterium]